MPINAPVDWRFSVVGKVSGNWRKITMLTGLAQDIELLWQLNRSTMLSFSVPSEDPRVNILHTDGHPFLDIGRRWVLGWRKAPAALGDSPGGWELKYAGRVWTVQDTADGTTGRTMVTCFDALKHTERRIARAADGTFRKQIKFWAVPGTTIAKALIDRTQTYAGTCRIDTGGTWTASSVITAAYDQAYVMPSIINITNTGTFDLDVAYLDGAVDGNFMQLGGKPRLGADRPNVILGYGAPPRRATGFDRTLSLDNLANSITLFGKSSQGKIVTAEDTASQDEFDVFEDVSVISDIETKELLQLLADEELFLRKGPNDMISIKPTPENAPRFFDEYFLGDTIAVRASLRNDASPYPVTRDTVNGVQRVYGAKLKVDDGYGEYVDELIVSSNAETA